MRKRLPESAQRFADAMRDAPIAELEREVYFVVTGSTYAFGGDRARLHREMQESSPHVRVFTELGVLNGLHRSEVREIYTSLSPQRQHEIDTMVTRQIRAEIKDQNLDRIEG
jgi:hypothetical protein